MSSHPGSPRIRYPDGNVLLRNLEKSYPVIERGEGLYLFDRSGRRWIDAAGGALVASCGHGVREIADAVARQLSRVGYVNGMQFTTEATETLATRLATLAKPIGLDRAAFLSSGSEAVEAAVKFARQLAVDRGQPERVKLITRAPGYHGNTLYALSASARPHYKKLYGPLLSPVLTVQTPYPYRSPLGDRYEAEGADYYTRELEELILKEGPHTIMAFVFETVSGSSTGGSTPPPGYFEKIEKLCRKHGILVIADEILCGAGRTGKFFAAEHYGLKPDVLTLGKGINGGYAPLSAVMVRDEDLRLIKSKSGYFQHAQTYLQAPCMTGAGVAVLDYFEKTRAVENARETGSYFLKRLSDTLSAHPHVGCVQGLGLLAGIEFVEDKKTRKPFDRSKKLIEGLVSTAFEKGLTLWPNMGQADGVNGDLVVMGPPLTLTRPQADEIVALLQDSIETFFKEKV